jgi:hypothetical protein
MMRAQYHESLGDTYVEQPDMEPVCS